MNTISEDIPILWEGMATDIDTAQLTEENEQLYLKMNECIHLISDIKIHYLKNQEETSDPSLRYLLLEHDETEHNKLRLLFKISSISRQKKPSEFNIDYVFIKNREIDKNKIYQSKFHFKKLLTIKTNNSVILKEFYDWFDFKKEIVPITDYDDCETCIFFIKYAADLLYRIFQGFDDNTDSNTLFERFFRDSVVWILDMSFFIDLMLELMLFVFKSNFSAFSAFDELKNKMDKIDVGLINSYINQFNGVVQFVFYDRSHIYFEAVPRFMSITQNLIKLVLNVIILQSFNGDKAQFMTIIVENLRTSFENLCDRLTSEKKKKVMSNIIKNLNDMVERHTVYNLDIIDIFKFLLDHLTEQKILKTKYYERLVKKKSFLLSVCLDYVQPAKKTKYVKYIFSINLLIDWLDLSMRDFLNSIMYDEWMPKLRLLKKWMVVLPLTDVLRLLYYNFLRQEL